VHRARERVRRDKPRFAVSEAVHRTLIQNYIQAVQAGDADRILALLAPDAVLVSDGGGKVWAARKPIIGALRIARLEIGVLRKRPGVFAFRILPINGHPGLVLYRDGLPAAATAFETDGERILSLFRVLNPDKLRGLLPLDEGADRPQ
jgi:RNA polymerase sigma-70 factor (ECF subfamily)